MTFNLDLSVMTLNLSVMTYKGDNMSRGPRVKDKSFSMRTDAIFRDNLRWLAKELGLPQAQCVEIAVNLFPELVKLYARLEQQVQEIKDNL